MGASEKAAAAYHGSDVDAEVARLRARLLADGYRELETYRDLRAGVRVHGAGERWWEAHREGTGAVAAVFQKDPSTWAETWRCDDVEVLVVRDEGHAGSRVAQLANYHLSVAEVSRA